MNLGKRVPVLLIIISLIASMMLYIPVSAVVSEGYSKAPIAAVYVKANDLTATKDDDMWQDVCTYGEYDYFKYLKYDISDMVYEDISSVNIVFEKATDGNTADGSIRINKYIGGIDKGDPVLKVDAVDFDTSWNNAASFKAAYSSALPTTGKNLVSEAMKTYSDTGANGWVSADRSYNITKYIKEALSLEKKEIYFKVSINPPNAYSSAQYINTPNIKLNVKYNTDDMDDSNTNFTQHSPWIKNLHLQTDIQAQNGLIAGEGCQIISCIDASPFTPEIMIAGTDTSGAFRSTDAGATWKFIEEGVEMWGIVDVAFDPNHPNVVYMAQSGPVASDYIQGMKAWNKAMGIYKSTDNGETFKQVLHCCPLGASTGNRFIQFDDAGNVYALSDIGLYKSSDGEEWSLLYEMQPSVINDLYVSGDGNVIVIAGKECGLVVSDNGGENFETKLSDPIYAIAKDPKNERFLMSCNGTKTGLFQSADFFETLEEIDYNKAYPVPMTIRFSTDGKVVYLVYNVLGGGAMRYSDDNMQSWKKPILDKNGYMEEGDLGTFDEGLFVSTTSPNVVYYSFGTCIFRSEDYGATFEYSNGNLSGIRADDMEFDSEGILYMAGMDCGLMKTTEPYSKTKFPTVHSFKNYTGKIENECSVEAVGIDPGDDNHIIIAIGGWYHQRLMETFDGGIVWNVIESVPLSENRYMMLDFADKNTIYSSFYRSMDGGKTWNANEVDIVDINSENISQVLGIKDEKVYLSNDYGESWTEIYYNPDYTLQTAVFGNDGYIYAGYNYGILMKIKGDEVKTISRKNGLDSDMEIKAIAVNPKNPQHIVIGGCYNGSFVKSEGLYESRDGGETWNLVPQMYGMGTVFKLAFTPDGDEVLASGFTGGIVSYDYRAYHATISEDEYVTKYIEFDKTANIQTMLKNTDEYNVGDNAAYDTAYGVMISNGSETDSKKSVYATLNVEDLRTDDIVSAELIMTRAVERAGTLYVSSLTTDNDWNDSSGFVSKYATEKEIPQSELWTSKEMEWTGFPFRQYSVDITEALRTALNEDRTFDTLALAYLNAAGGEASSKGMYVRDKSTDYKNMFYIKVKCRKATLPRYEYKTNGQLPGIAMNTKVYHNAENGEKTVQPIIAVYRDGGLIDVKIEEAVSLKGGSNEISAYYNTAGFEDKDIIRMFLWDDLLTMKPVNEGYGEVIGTLKNK